MRTGGTGIHNREINQPKFGPWSSIRHGDQRQGVGEKDSDQIDRCRCQWREIVDLGKMTSVLWKGEP